MAAAEAGVEWQADVEEQVLQLLLQQPQQQQQQQQQQEEELPPAELETPPWVEPQEHVLQSLSPSLKRAVQSSLRPYKRWKSSALVSATLFLLSSLMLWGRGDSLARLGVPPHKVPRGPLDVRGHLSYAAGLASRKEQWVSNVLGESPGGAFFGSDGHYYETPNAAKSLSLSERAGIMGGSVLSSLGLAAAVVTGVGLLSTALRAVSKRIVQKTKEAVTKVIHKLPWHRGRSRNLDSYAHRFLQKHLEGDSHRHVLLAVFKTNPTVINTQTSSSSGSSSSSSSGTAEQQQLLVLEGSGLNSNYNRGLFNWLQERLAAQVVLPPLHVFRGPFSSVKQTVLATRANMAAADFVRALLLPHCRAEVEIHPSLLSYFSLAVVEPAPSNGSKASRASWFRRGLEGDAGLRYLSPSLSMRSALDELNAYRGGAHFIIAVGPRPPSSGLEASLGSDVSSKGNQAREEKTSEHGKAVQPAAASAEGHSDAVSFPGERGRQFWVALQRHCLLFKKKVPLNISSATISLRLGLALASPQAPSCGWPGSSRGSLVLLHVPQDMRVKAILDALLEAFRSHGLLPSSKLSVAPRYQTDPETHEETATDAIDTGLETSTLAATDTHDHATAAAAATAAATAAAATAAATAAAATAAATAAAGGGGGEGGALISIPEGMNELALGLYVVASSADDEGRQKNISPPARGRLVPRLLLKDRSGPEKTGPGSSLKRVSYDTLARDLLDDYGFDGVYYGFVYLPHEASRVSDFSESSEARFEEEKSPEKFIHPLSANLAVLEGAVFNFATKDMSLGSSACLEGVGDSTPYDLLSAQQLPQESQL
ncbi:hypothetical protein Emag_000714 [Eimeria magna]